MRRYDTRNTFQVQDRVNGVPVTYVVEKTDLYAPVMISFDSVELPDKVLRDDSFATMGAAVAFARETATSILGGPAQTA